jgi:hypothetical protein
MDSDDLSGPTVQIRLSSDSARLAGSVKIDDGAEHSFSGWLELMRELESAHGAPASAEPSPGGKPTR